MRSRCELLPEEVPPLQEWPPAWWRQQIHQAVVRAVTDFDPDVVTHVAWGGGTAAVRTDMDLGRGVFAKTEYGIRRAVWDIAFGIVSGFRARDIAYYVLTRSLHPSIENLALRREARLRG